MAMTHNSSFHLQLLPGYIMEVVLYPAELTATSPQSLGKSLFYLDKKQQVKDMNNNLADFWLKPMIKSPLKASVGIAKYRTLLPLSKLTLSQLVALIGVYYTFHNNLLSLSPSLPLSCKGQIMLLTIYNNDLWPSKGR